MLLLDSFSLRGRCSFSRFLICPRFGRERKPVQHTGEACSVSATIFFVVQRNCVFFDFNESFVYPLFAN